MKSTMPFEIVRNAWFPVPDLENVFVPRSSERAPLGLADAARARNHTRTVLAPRCTCIDADRGVRGSSRSRAYRHFARCPFLNRQPRQILQAADGHGVGTVASLPAANTALSPAVQVAGIPVPLEFEFQLAFDEFHVPLGVAPPAPPG